MTEHRRPAGLKGSWEWLIAAAQLPSKPITVTAGATTQLVYSGRCILTGWILQNTATTGQGFDVYDGQDANGLHIGHRGIGASTSINEAVGTTGALCDIGAYITMPSGTIGGSLLIIPLWHYEFTAPGD